jgi:IS5 family transposase
MRSKIREQLRLVEPSIVHEHANELSAINRLLGDTSGIIELVHDDLVRDLSDAEAGRDGMLTAEQVIKVLVIKQMNSFSYEQLSFHLEDSRCYRWFCGIGICDKVPSGSTLQRDIKRLRPETLESINRLIVGKAAELNIENGRKVRTDCTVVETNIHHPLDSALLLDSVRVLCRETQKAKEHCDVSVRDHRRYAKRRALEILNAKNDKVRTKAYGKLLKITHKVVADAERARDELKRLTTLSLTLLALTEKLGHFTELARRVISQTERRVINGEKVPANEKIVSIFEPHTDIIVKDRRETYYGHKITLTGGTSGLLTDLCIEDGNPADSSLAQRAVARQKEIYGRAPRQIAFDGGFASNENLENIKSMGVQDVMFSKRRGLEISEMTRSSWVYKKLRNFRAGIEGMISFLKRSVGLRRCTWRGKESFKSYAWSSVITANLVLMARHLLA